MSDPLIPPGEEARAIASANSSGRPDRHSARRFGANLESCGTLQALCRAVIVANLERFPPDCFEVLDRADWNAIVRLRNEKTAPQNGTGGLDGSGRVVPSISDRVLAEIERANPQLAQSEVADELVWSTCVEYRFRAGGLTRPPALMCPWPVRVDRLKRAGERLVELTKTKDSTSEQLSSVNEIIQFLQKTPMNVSLLQASGVGRQVKTFVKHFSKQPQHIMAQDVSPNPLARGQKVRNPLKDLERVLQEWKDVAAKSGVAMTTTPLDSDGADTEQLSIEEEDMRLAESCNTWRGLFSVLSQRETERRASQGAKLREIRKNLASGRPKIIKVRPAPKRHEDILSRPQQKLAGSSSAMPPRNNKLDKLRQESAIVAARQKSSAVPKRNKPASFGAAVAFASVSKSNAPKGKSTGKLVALGGGKTMKMPAKKGPRGAKHSIYGHIKRR